MGKFVGKAAVATVALAGAYGLLGNSREDTSAHTAAHTEESELDSALSRALFNSLIKLENERLNNPDIELSDFKIQFGLERSIIAVRGHEDIRFWVGNEKTAHSSVQFKDSATGSSWSQSFSGSRFDYFVDLGKRSLFNSLADYSLSDKMDIAKADYEVSVDKDRLIWDSDEITTVFTLNGDNWISSVDGIHPEHATLKCWQTIEGNEVEYGAELLSDRSQSAIVLDDAAAASIFGRFQDGLRPKIDHYRERNARLVERAFAVIASSDLPNSDRAAWGLEARAEYTDNTTPLQYGRRYRCNLGDGLGIEVHQVVVAENVNGVPLFDCAIRMRKVDASGNFGEVINRGEGSTFERAICKGGNALAMYQAIENL